MPIDDSQRVRVIRAIIGMTSRAFAQRIGVSPGSITAWEKGRSAPIGKSRVELAKLCQEHKIGFLPSGLPVPFVDCLIFKEEKQ